MNHFKALLAAAGTLLTVSACATPPTTTSRPTISATSAASAATTAPAKLTKREAARAAAAAQRIEDNKAEAIACSAFSVGQTVHTRAPKVSGRGMTTPRKKWVYYYEIVSFDSAKNFTGKLLYRQDEISGDVFKDEKLPGYRVTIPNMDPVRYRVCSDYV